MNPTATTYNKQTYSTRIRDASKENISNTTLEKLTTDLAHHLAEKSAHHLAEKSGLNDDNLTDNDYRDVLEDLHKKVDYHQILNTLGLKSVSKYSWFSNQRATGKIIALKEYLLQHALGKTNTQVSQSESVLFADTEKNKEALTAAVNELLTAEKDDETIINSRSFKLLTEYHTKLLLNTDEIYKAISNDKKADSLIGPDKYNSKNYPCSGNPFEKNSNQSNNITQKEVKAYLNSNKYDTHCNSIKVYSGYGENKQAQDLLVKIDLLMRDSVNIGMSTPNKNKSTSFISTFTNKDNIITMSQPPALSSQTMFKLKRDQFANVFVLSLSAPPLDTNKQPTYARFVTSEQLNAAEYKKEMERLADIFTKDLVDRFQSRAGIKRVFIPGLGQGAFLDTLSNDEKIIARNIFTTAFINAVNKIKKTTRDKLTFLYSKEFSQHNIKENYIVPTSIQNGDYIINAWDPHSQYGNGNVTDRSLDGVVGGTSFGFFANSPLSNNCLRVLEPR